MLNARLGSENNIDEIEIPLLSDILPQSTEASITERSCCDQIINQHGRKVNQICNDLELHVANGRTPGDLLGNFTCYTNNGSSTVDLVIADQHTIHNIKYLKVLPPEYTSVHGPISFKLRCDAIVPLKKNTSIPLPPKIIWEEDKEQILKDSLLSANTMIQIQNITDTLKNENSPKECIDECLHQMNNILMKEAKNA